MKKRLFSTVIIFALLLSSLSLIVTAAPSPMTLTQSDFVQPSSGNLVIEIGAGRTATLSSDIDLSAITCEVNINIAQGAVLDGDGKSIYGAKTLFVNIEGGTVRDISFGTEAKPMETSFGFVNDKKDTANTWENVKMYLYNIDRTAAAEAAGFAKFVNGSHVFRNCEMNIDWEKTTGVKRIAGWIGYANDSNVELTWENCTAKGVIRDGGGSSLGGFLAECGSAKSVTLTNCFNYITMISNATARNVVGFAPLGADTNVTIDNCVNHGNIVALSQTSAAVGGITTGEGNCEVKNCSNYGSLMSSSYAGGIIGSVSGDISAVNCENYGSVNGAVAAGGVIGFNGGNAIVNACRVIGDIDSAGDSGNVVGAIGESGTLKITDTFAFGAAKAALVGKGALSSDSAANCTLASYTDAQGASAMSADEAVQALATAQMTEGVKVDALTQKIVMLSEVNIESIVLDKAALEMPLHGESVTLMALTSPINTIDKSVVWTTSDEAVVKVENGILTAAAKGTAIVTVASAVNSNVKATCKITVTDPVSEVIELINKIPNPVTLACKKEIVEAENAYNALSEDLQAHVTNRQALFDARATYNALVEERKNSKADKDGAETTESTTPETSGSTTTKKKGCGSAVLGSAAVIAIAATGTCFALKKKED